jgi:hypothetical protein
VIGRFLKQCVLYCRRATAAFERRLKTPPRGVVGSEPGLVVNQHGEPGVEEEVPVAMGLSGTDSSADGSANDEGVGDEAHERASAECKKRNAPEGAW